MLKAKPLTFSFCLGLTLVFGSGCASTSSHVLVGSQHPAIDPSQVKLYLRPPANYEDVGLVSADSRNSFAASVQAQTDTTIARLKTEAAKLGANGILLSYVGDQYAGSVDSISGTVFDNLVSSGAPSAAPLFVTGTRISIPLLNKAAAGIAIYVPQK